MLIEPARVAEERGLAAAIQASGGDWGCQWSEQFRLAPRKWEQLLGMDPVVVAASLRASAEGYRSPGRLCFAG